MDELTGERTDQSTDEPTGQAIRRHTGQRQHVGLRRVLADLEAFGSAVLGMPLRPYQAEVARAVLASIAEGCGHSLTVLMPRQSGKNQLSAHLEAYLLTRRQRTGGSLVKCAPTYQPQVLVSISRLLRALDNPLTAGRWRRRDGHIVELGRASIAFYSAEPGANVVGATASLLLECDEAQDVLPDKWEKDFRPMGATTNVTSVLYGTPCPVPYLYFGQHSDVGDISRMVLIGLGSVDLCIVDSRAWR